MAKKNVAQKKTPNLAEIDALLDDEDIPTGAIFDALTAYQLAQGASLEGGPIPEIQKLMDSWADEGSGDPRIDWVAAVNRAKGAKPKPVNSVPKQPYSTPAAKAALEDARCRLPVEYAVASRDALAATGKEIVNHNYLSLAHALAYADLGLHAIDGHALDRKGQPTDAAKTGKVPRGAGWEQRASTSHSALIAAWTGDGEYPPNKEGKAYRYADATAPRNVNIAFPEGCGLFVLDIDGDEGKAALAALEAEYGPLPKTWTSETGSGGLHLIFKAEGVDIRNTASEIAGGVDIRGKNGQIVAPPSVHPSGMFYRWADDCAPWECDVAEAPEWLRDLSYMATKGRDDKTNRAKAKAKKKTNREKPSGSRHAKPGGGWQKHLDRIGHGDGLDGFNSTINDTACAYFGQHGVDADAEPLKEALIETILVAPCKDDRAERRYATDEYLDGRIEGAREYIAEQGEAEPVSFDTATLTERIEAAGFDKDSSAVEIGDFFSELLDENADVTTFGRATELLEKPRTALGKRELNALLKKVRDAHRAANYSDTTDQPVIGETDFPDMIQYAVASIEAANEEDPFLFEYMGNLARITVNADGQVRVEILSKDAYFSELAGVTTWFKAKQIGENVIHIKTSPPDDVTKVLYGGRNVGSLPLVGTIKTPVFSRDGELVNVPGYHAASGLYYHPDNSLDVPQVSKKPTADEIYEAKRLFIEEVFGDFPLGGFKRDEIMSQGLDGDGIPAVTHLIGMVLLMFCRDMVKGPTPGHLLTKPSPGTGASLLTDICTTMANGEATAPMTLPHNSEEMTKTLVTTMADGSNVVYFDNIDKDVNSGVLASAMTAPKVKGRMLGHSKNLESEVRCVWILCGNNVRLSDELIRRLVMVDLDAQMEHPEERSGWRHKDIGGGYTRTVDALCGPL